MDHSLKSSPWEASTQNTPVTVWLFKLEEFIKAPQKSFKSLKYTADQSFTNVFTPPSGREKIFIFRIMNQDKTELDRTQWLFLRLWPITVIVVVFSYKSNTFSNQIKHLTLKSSYHLFLESLLGHKKKGRNFRRCNRGGIPLPAIDMQYLSCI